MQHLLTPITIGDLKLPNRIIMAPLSRCRATPDTRVPTPMMIDYYTQRTCAGLIIAEASSVDPMGVGYTQTPAIWSKEQTENWKPIVKSVHDKGTKIFLQLWHVGRASHGMFLNGGIPIAPSPIAINSHVHLVKQKVFYPIPRALELSEIPGVIEAFRVGAINAKEAGFDGVELHAANGYLLDQFLQDSTNKRTDEYGGSIENRARLLLEVTDAVISVWGPNRVGVHLAPRGDQLNMGDSNKLATFSYVAEQLGRRKIAFIFTRERPGADSISPILKQKFGGVLISNEEITPQVGEDLLEKGAADAIAFGQLFIANPDLVDRIRNNWPLNEPIPETFYSHGIQGYLDYPFYNKAKL